MTFWKNEICPGVSKQTIAFLGSRDQRQFAVSRLPANTITRTRLPSVTPVTALNITCFEGKKVFSATLIKKEKVIRQKQKKQLIIRNVQEKTKEKGKKRG